MANRSSGERVFIGIVCLFLSTALYAAPKNSGQVTDVVAVALPAQGSNQTIDDSNLLSDQLDLSQPPYSTLLGKQAPSCTKRQALIIHLAHWAASDAAGPFQLLKSDWSVYHASGNTNSCIFKKATQRTDPQGTEGPLLYGDKSGFLIGINSFVKLDAENGVTTTPIAVSVSITYKVSATAETPENVQNLGMLISGLLGKGAAGGAGAALPAFPLYVAVGKLDGYKRTPFTFNIGYNLVPAGAANPGQSAPAPGAPPQTKTTPVPKGYVGIAYSEHLPFEGGIGQKTFSLRLGNQPPEGLTLDPSGILHGAPKRAGTSTFFVEVTDSAPAPTKVPMLYMITIAAEPKSAEALKGGAPPAKPASTATDAKPSDTASTDSTKSDQQTAAVVDCTAVKDDKSPCSFKRSFRSEDKEYWDIGLSVPIPGVKETKYTLSNGAAKSSVTTHTDVYAFLDLYPLANWFDKRSAAPHFDVGLPVTGQTFYRPFFGAAENLTSWTGLRRQGFPLEISVFAGVVYMRIQVPTQATSGGTTTTVISSTRTVKPLFGLELSVTDLASKLGGKSKK
jgi:hypothetical protein